MHTPQRKRMPSTRASLTRKQSICGFEVYITVGFYDEDGSRSQPGEIFVKLAKHGSEIAGVMDTAATIISMALQYGVPWQVIEEKMRHTNFGTHNDERYSSLCDGIACCVSDLIRERSSIVGEDEPASGTGSIDMPDVEKVEIRSTLSRVQPLPRGGHD